jgi:tape measure domain-containing protein
MSFFTSGGDPGTTERIHVDADEAEVRRVAEMIVRILRTTIDSALRGMGREIGDVLSSALRGGGARQAAEAIRDVGRAGRSAQEEIEELGEDLRALATRSRAFQNSLGNLGQDRGLFAVFDTQVRRLLELEKEFQRDRVLLASEAGKERLEALRAEARAVIAAHQGEQVSVGRIVDAGRSHNVASQQQETTLRNAEIRTQGALAVAQEQRTARARIEAFRFATRQILFLERQVVAAFRGTLNLAGSLGRGIAAGLGRVASVFRRGDAQLNEGLQGALSQRERAMRESFNRQESLTRRTVSEQSRQIQRLQEQQSKGFAGILSGRSQLGAALGVGGLLGGGLLGANFIQGGLERFTTLERINIQLDRLTGSATATRDILDELVNLARETPLELTDVSQAAVGLLAAGTGLKEVVPFVKSLADAIGFTGGGAEQLQRVALAIRQIASKGRLQGEELRQLAESLPGLNITQLLADQITGGDTGLLLKMSERGEVSARTFTEAFAAALRADPRIVGAATATVNTLGGQIAILKETFDTLGAAVIGAIEPFLLFSIKGTTDRLNFLIKLITNEASPSL